jgi:uncharacterized damage-inducible protein DinB
VVNKNELARLLEYNVWANHRMLRVSALLTTEAFIRNLGASHGGVRGTLFHIMTTEQMWLDRWMGVATAAAGESDFDGIIALRDRWASMEEKQHVWFEGLPASALEQPIRYTSNMGEAFEVPLGKLVHHMVNHSTYHRGQLAILLRQVGAKPAATDMLVWDLNRDGPWGGSAALGPGGRGL